MLSDLSNFTEVFLVCSSYISCIELFRIFFVSYLDKTLLQRMLLENLEALLVYRSSSSYSEDSAYERRLISKISFYQRLILRVN